MESGPRKSPQPPEGKSVARWLWPGGIVVSQRQLLHRRRAVSWANTWASVFQIVWALDPFTRYRPSPGKRSDCTHLSVLHAILKFESTRTHTTLQMHARIPSPVPGFLATERWLLSGHPTSCAILPTHIPPQGQHLA